MFWESVSKGLYVLTFWQAYVAFLIYFFLSVTPLIISYSIIRNFEAAGCLGTLLQPFFYAFATWVFVLTMAPILLGLSGKAAWSFPWIILIDNPWWTIKIVGVILLVSIAIAAFIPIIGVMPSVQTLVSGTISIMSVLGLIDQIRPDLNISNISLFPGYLYMVGFLLISGITLRVGLFITTCSCVFNW